MCLALLTLTSRRERDTSNKRVGALTKPSEAGRNIVAPTSGPDPLNALAMLADRVSDPSKFPVLARYVEALPQGLASYPEDRAKASLCGGMIDAFPIRTDDIPALPAELRYLVESPVPVSSWIPEVHSHAILLAIYDRHFETPDAFAAQAYAMQKALFSGPLYAIALKIVSPTRLLKTAAARWRMFHRGATFVITELAANHVMVRIEHPPFVYEPMSRRGMCEGLRAVLDLSTGGGASVEMIETKSDFMTLCARWR